MWGKPGYCENRPANNEIKNILNVQIRILSSPIFIISVKSIKLTSNIHNWNVYELINQFSSYFDWKKFAKCYDGLKWTDEGVGIQRNG